MKKLLALSLVAAILMSGCDDDDPAPTPPAAKSYQPKTVGSTWTYQFKNNSNSATSTYTLTATSTDTTINSKTYKIYTRSDGGAKEYYYSNGSTYYQYGGIAGVTGPTELLYLKTDAAANATWEENVSVNLPALGNAAATLKVGYQVVEKLSSYAVGSTTYNNVIHIKVTLSNITVSGAPIVPTLQDLHFWYAEGIGRIKSTIKFKYLALDSDNETTLQSSTIVP